MNIGKKIRWSFWIIISTIFLITSLLFHVFSHRYLLLEAKKELHNDAKIMSELLMNDTLEKRKIRIKLSEVKNVKTAHKLIQSSIIVSNNKDEVIYSTLPENVLNDYLDGTLNKDRYVMETLPVRSKTGVKKGSITLVSPIENILSLSALLRRTLIVGFIFSGLIAIIVAIVLERNLTRPIRTLNRHMQRFRIKEDYKPLELTSKDEIAELAASFNSLALQLKQYDQQQNTFLQNTSHELKTPLMSIQGNAEGILDGVIEDEDIPKSLDIIIKESQRLKKIVEDITLLTKLENAKESYHFMKRPLLPLIEEVTDSLSMLASQKGISFFISAKPDVKLPVDANRLKQALHNILSNAIRYANEKITIDVVLEEKWIKLCISDDGEGFSENEQLLFQRFYKGKNGGTGIGLAITKAIIEAHRGTISAMNQKNSGAIFVIKLPRE
ncbi:sensor histidine kinase [Falsibacillus pallidus]|uniref:sensor histidine kinase n=1 Tax=Falsibacillus pallidus TaxID=493781 RepID=UPI003D95F310